MHSTTIFLTALLPFLGVEGKSYRGSGHKSSSSQSALGSSLMASSLQSTDTVGDTPPGTSCSNGGDTKNAGNAAGCNDCGLSSFLELSTNADQNPLVTDCQIMINNIQADQEWTVTSENRNIVYNGTCAFNAVATDGGQANIGNADVIDLVTSSITKFAKDGRVGCQGGYDQTVTSAGTMNCDDAEVPDAQQVRIDWTLTSSGQKIGDSSGWGDDGNSDNPWWSTGGQGGVSNDDNNGGDIWTTNQGGSEGDFQDFDVSNLQNEGNGNGGHIQRRSGKLYKKVKF